MTSTLIEPRKNGADIRRLNDRQRVFVMELLADEKFDATAAARKAGYKWPAQQAHSLLRHRVVRAILGKALRERAERCEVDADRVVTELAANALLNPQEMFDEEGNLLHIQDMPEHVARTIASMEVETTIHQSEDGEQVETTRLSKIKFNPKLQALELLGRHMGMFDKRIQLDVPVGAGVLAKLLELVEGGTIIDSNFIEEKVDAQDDGGGVS